MSINQRIKFLYKSLKINQSQFSKEIGQSSGTISNIVRSVNKPSFDVIKAILQRYNVNPEWLILDKGEMWKGEEKINKVEEPAAMYGDMKEINKLLKNRVSELEREIKRKDPALARELGID